MRAHVVVRGRVQGVFFRAATRDRARSLGINGWVANEPDGSVQAVLEGPRERVEALLRWCHSGPRGAQVDDVHVTWDEPRGDAGFAVR